MAPTVDLSGKLVPCTGVTAARLLKIRLAEPAVRD